MCDFWLLATRRLSRCKGDHAKFLAITFHKIRARGVLSARFNLQQDTSKVGSSVRNSKNASREVTNLESDSEQDKAGERLEEKKFRTLKMCVTAWRFRHMDSIALAYDEFERGMKILNYFPPIVVSEGDWNERVVRYRLANFLLSTLPFLFKNI